MLSRWGEQLRWEHHTTLKDKTELSVAKAQNYIGGGTPHILICGGGQLDSGKIIYSEGGDTAHRTYFVGVGTLYNIVRKSLTVGGCGGGPS